MNPDFRKERQGFLYVSGGFGSTSTILTHFGPDFKTLSYRLSNL